MRTLRNLRKIGIRDYLHQMQNIGDTKAGTYIATDRYGNKYYENQEQELPRMYLSRDIWGTTADSCIQYEPGGSTTSKPNTARTFPSFP